MNTHQRIYDTGFCPGCRRRRSITQFDDKKHCRMCRGIKTPVVNPARVSKPVALTSSEDCVIIDAVVKAKRIKRQNLNFD